MFLQYPASRQSYNHYSLQRECSGVHEISNRTDTRTDTGHEWASAKQRAMAKRRSDPPLLEEREFKSVEEIDSGIAKLERRIRELEQLEITAAVLNDTGADDV